MGISAKKRLRVFGRDSYQCVFCKSSADLTVDHITPVSKGGTHNENNLRTLCQKCNIKRGNFNPTWRDKIFHFIFTRKQANNLRNELLGVMASKDGTLKLEVEQSLNARIENIKPSIQEFLQKTKKDLDITLVGVKNTAEIGLKRAQERDDKLLDILYKVSDRVEALENYLNIEYVEEHIKTYRQRL